MNCQEMNLLEVCNYDVYKQVYHNLLCNNSGNIFEEPPPPPKKMSISGADYLLERVNKAETDFIDLKKEIFEMEVRLLKAVSDNKIYLVQKIKEFKAMLKASHGM